MLRKRTDAHEGSARADKKKVKLFAIKRDNCAQAETTTVHGMVTNQSVFNVNVNISTDHVTFDLKIASNSLVYASKNITGNVLLFRLQLRCEVQ